MPYKTLKEPCNVILHWREGKLPDASTCDFDQLLVTYEEWDGTLQVTSTFKTCKGTVWNWMRPLVAWAPFPVPYEKPKD